MKRAAPLVAMVGFLALALGSPAKAAEPMASGCYRSPPLCSPGMAAVCICDNRGQNCQWACAK